MIFVDKPAVRDIPLDQALNEMQNDIIRRSAALIGDTSPPVREIINNNLSIFEDLQRAGKRAARSRELAKYAVGKP